MPRRILKRITPHPHKLRERWFIRMLGERFAHPALWTPHRRAVAGAFGAGLAICFVPLPIHVPLAALVALLWHLNVPTIIATVLLVNPLTAVPVYYFAYRVGALLVEGAPRRFAFEPSWEWLQHGLGPVWKPFLLGCLICAIVLGFAGRFGLDLLWRRLVRYRYRTRRGASARV